MQSFHSFIVVYDLIVENAIEIVCQLSRQILAEEDYPPIKKGGAAAPKRSDAYKRYYEPQEWDYISSLLRKSAEEKAAKAGIDPVTGKRVKPYKAKGAEATPPEERMGHTRLGQPALTTAFTGDPKSRIGPILQKPFSDVFTKKLPTMRAWERGGLDADPEAIHTSMKQSGEEILPSDSYIRSYGIKKLKDLYNRIAADPNAQLSPREQRVIDVWQQLSSQQLVGRREAVDVSQLQINPDHVYEYLDKKGLRDIAITPEEAELEYIEEIRDGIINKTLPSIEQVEKLAKPQSKPVRGSIIKWLGQKHKHKQVSMDPEAMQGIEQWLEKGGDPSDMPNAYVGFGRNVSDLKTNPEVMAKYKANRDLWIDQIVRPSCVAAGHRVRQIAVKVAAGGGRDVPIAIGNLLKPGQEAPGQDPSYCGLGGDPESEKMLNRVNTFLEDGDGDFATVVRQIIDGMENTTSFVDPTTGEPWMDVPKFRQARAYTLAVRAFDGIYKKMMRRKEGEAAGGVGKRETKGEKKKRQAAEKDVQELLTKAQLPPEAEELMRRIRKLDPDEDRLEIMSLMQELMPILQSHPEGMKIMQSIMQPAA